MKPLPFGMHAPVGTVCPACKHVETTDADAPHILLEPHGGAKLGGVDMRLPMMVLAALFGANKDAAEIGAEFCADVAHERVTGTPVAQRPDNYRCACGHSWPVTCVDPR